MRLNFKKDNQDWSMWNARVSTDWDSLGTFSILILAHLEIDGVRVADYGVSKIGQEASTSYDNFETHSQLYDIILADAKVEGVDTSIMDNEYV
jgi:hypothetical protein